MTGCYSDQTSEGHVTEVETKEEIDKEHVTCFLDCTIPRHTAKSELPEHLWLI